MMGGVCARAHARAREAVAMVKSLSDPFLARACVRGGEGVPFSHCFTCDGEAPVKVPDVLREFVASAHAKVLRAARPPAICLTTSCGSS
eukprot:11187947-Lingulodinium_polyedra.AAC.1